ncbi:MAG: hypothetical protein L3K05_08850, partial [Thermoplasmata archaeon]|nr:hypothetical protein [Thermoplasmata archaeon]
MGSGKTSLLYAIEMALFGFAEVEAAYLVRHLAADAEVRLSLADETHQYELVRRFARRSRRGKETFELEENSFSADGATRGYSTTELRQRAIDLLGFPDNPNPRAHSDLWRWAVYVPQERMREVLDQKPEDRLETVRKALGLEQYRTAADNALDVAAELRRAADVRSAEAERMAHWTDDLPRWTSTGQERQEELDQARPAERRTRDQLVEAEERLNEVELELKAFLIRESEGARLSEESKRLARQAVDRRRIAHERRSESEKIRARAEEAQAIADGSQEARATETRLIGEREGVRNQLRALEAVRQALAAARSEVSAAETAERSAAASSADAQREQTRLLQSLGEVTREDPVEEPREPTPATLGAIETQLQLTESELEQAQRESSVLEIEVAEVEELLRAGVCPRCKQAVSAGDFGAHREEARLQLANSDERRNRLRTTRDGLRADRARRETYERLHERWGQLEGRRSLAREAIASGDARSRRTRELLDESRTRLTA